MQQATVYYAGLIIKEAESRGVNVYDLKSPKLTQENFTRIIDEKCPSFIFFNAHGDEKTIYGDKINGEAETLVKEGENNHLLDSKLVYSRTCLSAYSLGKSCAEGCFIGYRMPFSFYVNEEWSTKPANDNTAKLFFEPSNIIVSSIIKGNTAGESVNRSLAMAQKTILRLLREKAEPGSLACVRVLWNNMQATSLEGNGSMSFE